MKKLVFLMLMLAGCTENVRAKTFGGSAKYCLNPGEKLETMTWKEGNLWLLTRPMREGEKPETHSFQEQSNFGVMQGSVVVVERAADDKSACK
jgi:predicted type IV restriction endonuclease